MIETPLRQAARLVVLDSDGKILLVAYAKSRGSGEREIFWATPGGALEPEEDFKAAAGRELLEETGLDDQIGEHLWTARMSFEAHGSIIQQLEQFYLVKLDRPCPAVANQSAEPIVELRWWSLDTLRDSNETIYPVGLVVLLAPVLKGEIPSSPVNI